jgi:two-component system LytT family response regulator
MKRDDRKIRIVLIDNDPRACERVRALIEQQQELQLVAQCAGAAEAVRTIQAYRPEIAVIPLRMADGTALDIVEQVTPDRMPSPIFTSAPDQQSARVLEECGLSCISEAIDSAELLAAITRIRAERAAPGAHAELSKRLWKLLAHGGSNAGDRNPDNTLARFVVRERNRVHTIPAEEVDWIEGARNYVRLHVGERTHLLRGPLTAIHAQLDPRLFARIHRSIIVNVDRIGEVQPWVGGDYVAVLRSGKKLRVSRNFRETILRLAS